MLSKRKFKVVNCCRAKNSNGITNTFVFMFSSSKRVVGANRHKCVWKYLTAHAIGTTKIDLSNHLVGGDSGGREERPTNNTCFTEHDRGFGGGQRFVQWPAADIACYAGRPSALVADGWWHCRRAFGTIESPVINAGAVGNLGVL